MKTDAREDKKKQEKQKIRLILNRKYILVEIKRVEKGARVKIRG